MSSTGDARASSANGLTSEFLGDYSFADATDVFGVTVWNDVREAADCPAIGAFRQDFAEAAASGRVEPEDEDAAEARFEDQEDAEPAQEGDAPRPAPNYQCPDTWGNSDIWSFT